MFRRVLPLLQHASCFIRGETLAPAACREAIKNPTARLAVGDKVKDSAVPPRLTRHRCRIHSSTANTVRLLTRALRPRLLVTFRLGPPGPILSAFSTCQRILTRFLKFSARTKPQRAPSAHTHTHHARETISHSPTRTCVLETPRARHTRRTRNITPTDGLAMSRAPTYTTDSHVIDFLPRLPRHPRAVLIVCLRK